MKTLGLTGPTGAGKGAVSSLFCNLYQIPSIDTDRVYHDLLIPPSACLDELVSAFGQEILAEDGTLDRPTLSRIVFSDLSRKKQQLLNHITHRHVLDRTREMLADYQKQGLHAVLVDAPLLYESGFDTACDAVIAVLAPRDVRKMRIIERDGLSEERAEARLNMQKQDSYYIERTPHVICNDGSLTSLQAQVERVATALGVVRT
jgi:dephospho-CoA kinase